MGLKWSLMEVMEAVNAMAIAIWRLCDVGAPAFQSASSRTFTVITGWGEIRLARMMPSPSRPR